MQGLRLWASITIAVLCQAVLSGMFRAECFIQKDFINEMVSPRCSLCTSCHQGCSLYSLWAISKKPHEQGNANDHYDGSICVDRAFDITMMEMLP